MSVITPSTLAGEPGEGVREAGNISL